MDTRRKGYLKVALCVFFGFLAAVLLSRSGHLWTGRFVFIAVVFAALYWHLYATCESCGSWITHVLTRENQKGEKQVWEISHYRACLRCGKEKLFRTREETDEVHDKRLFGLGG